MKRIHAGIGGGVLAVAALGAWWALTPGRLGLKVSRLVVVAGDATVDAVRLKVAKPVPVGATLHTGQGSACFSVHASRVCLGASTEVHLAELAEHSARIECTQGTIVVRSAGDDLHLVLRDGTVDVRDGAAALENAGTNTVVRVLEGSAKLQGTGRDAAVLVAPGAIGLHDGVIRSAAAMIEKEETGVLDVARRWQGSAGAIVQVDTVHGRVEIDGSEVGHAPASVLLDEGEHTLVMRDGMRETSRDKLKIGAGETVVHKE